MKLIEPPLAEPHERWCERSEIPQSEEFPPTRLPGYCSVQIISYRAGIILFDYLYHNGTVRLFRLLNDPVLSVVLVQSFFVLRNFLLYQRDA